MANPTALTIIGLARDLLRSDSGSDVPVIGDSFMLSGLSDANLKWVRAFRKSGEPPVDFFRETGFDLVADTAVNQSAGIATTDTSFVVDDSDDFEATSGALVIWDDNMPDVVSYTTNTVATETFSGVTGLAFAHEDNDIVQALYKLPTNFGSFREAPTWGDGVLVNGIPHKFIQGPPPSGHFSMYDDGTNKFLWLPRDNTGSASVLYNKVSATIDSTDDTVDVPDEYKFFLVWHLVAFAFIGRSGEAEKMLFAQNESNKLLQEALDDRNTGKKIRTRSFARTTGDYVTIGGFTYPLWRG